MNGGGDDFEARRGFAQGATESPLLWIIFYDMVLCAILKGGGGSEVRLVSNSLHFDHGAGLAAFMDDLMVSARSVAGLKALIKLLDWVLTTVELALVETKTFHMGLQWMETSGRTRYQLRMSDEC